MNDINVSGIQMALDLDTSGATRALEGLAKSTTSIEEEFASSIQAVFGEAKKAYSGISSNMQDISRYSTLSLKDAVKEVEHLNELIDLSNTIADHQKTEGKFFKDILKDFSKLEKAITEKNKLHKEENDLVEAEAKLHDQINKSVDDRNKKQKDARDILNEISRAVKQIHDFALKTDAAAEAFVTINYRAYDSQNQLAQSVRDTAVQYGLLLDSATETMALAGAMALQRGELEKYTKVIAMTNRFTGISNKALAEHAFRMRQVGMNAEGLESYYNKIGEAMRKYKLSTEDMSRAMEDTTWSPAMAEYLFGPGAAEKLTLFRAGLAGIGKDAGISAEAMGELSKQLESDDAMLFLNRFVEGGVRNLESYQKAIQGASAYANQLYQIREAALASGDTDLLFEANKKLEVMAKTMGLANKQQLVHLGLLDQQKVATLTASSELEHLSSITEKYAEADMTLTMAAKQLASTLFSMISFVLEPLRLALIEVNKWLREILIPVQEGIAKFAKWWKEIEEGGGVLGGLAVAAKYAAGALAVLLGVGILVASAVASLIISLGAVGFLGAGLAKLAAGIALVGKALLPASMAAMAFGFALLMAGGGAYLFALAVEKIVNLMKASEDGAKLVAVAMIGLGAAMVAMAISAGIAIAIIAAAATATAPIQPLMWAFAGVLLAIGFSAMMAGAGVMLFGKGISLIGDGVQKAGEGMLDLGKGLALVAVNNLSVWGWSKLAGGLTAVAIGAGRAAPAMDKIYQSISKMASEEILKLAEGFIAIGKILENLSTESAEGLADHSVDSLEKLKVAGPAIVDLVDGLKTVGSSIQMVGPYFDAVSASLEKMSGALDTLRQQSTDLVVIGDRMVEFSMKMWLSGRMLYAATGSFGWLSLVRLVSFLEYMSLSFSLISVRLKKNVDLFVDPVNNLSSSLLGLAEAVASFDTVGDRLSDNLESLITPLNKYSAELEAVAERIDAAIMKKMLPALKEAENAGIKDALKSEAITSVEVLPPRENKNQEKMIALLEQQNMILTSLNEKLLGVGSDDLKKIRETLEGNTNVAKNVVPNLSSDLTGWA